MKIGEKHSPEAIEKNRQRHLGRKHSPEVIEKIQQASLGRKHSPEVIEKMRGKKRSSEVIEKIRQANLGRKHSPEAIEKIRQAKLGKKRSPEVIEKCRQAHLGKNLGKKQSPENIEKNRQGHLNMFSALERNITEKYCPLFNDEIREAVRERDSYICQYCGKKQSDLTGFHKKFPVHHIHYDKKNCFPDLITLCISCNSKANKNRDEWEIFYMNKLNDRNLLLWTKCRNKQEYL